ncbi:peptidyl-prolyl cis-trans isomerase FKBP4-like isoform X2 [Babylonia areolata]|uniref:peptidyl-prolyl cis-trans isomerase FKBP4-like isoform X2 n=1 Tax=Babylonia areolata TaxID=304850 RepID=UPI003FCF4491
MTDESLVGVVRDLTWDKQGGILLETINPGRGDEGPRIGDRVFVHYVGMLEDGTVFDSSRNKKEPFQFTIGRAEVVMAWDCAIANMRKGEMARITSKPEYAYEAEGAAKHPGVPCNTTVIFEVELIEWKGVDLSPDQDGGIIKRMERQGQRLATPVDGALVTIRYQGWCEGQEIEVRQVTYTQGEGDDVGLIPGVEIAAKHMKKGELDRLTLSSKYAYGEEGSADLGVLPRATVVCDVEMVHFELPLDPMDMDVEEKLEESLHFKAKGTTYFKKGKYERAISYYRKMVTYLEPVTSDLQGDQGLDRHHLLLAAHLNLALCHLKLNHLSQVETECSRALELDSHSVKALFRRGQARLLRCEYSRAVEDFGKVLEFEPGNRAALTQLSACRQRQCQAYLQEKQRCFHMFGPGAQMGGEEERHSHTVLTSVHTD